MPKSMNSYILDCDYYYIAKYMCTVSKDYKKCTKSYLCKSTKTDLKTEARFRDVNNLAKDDPIVIEMSQHNKKLAEHERIVPAFIISPMVYMVWLHLCPNFRNSLDFNFQRKSSWTDDTKINRFNDTLYMQRHAIYDKHKFALLSNGSFLYKNVICQSQRNNKYFVVKRIVHRIPDHITNCQRPSDFKESDNPQWWKNETVMICQPLKEKSNCFLLKSRRYYHVLSADDPFVVVNADSFAKPLANEDGRVINIETREQHMNVANNNPHIFALWGLDKYHHTTFTGKRDWDTHGIYWWIGNQNANVQFTPVMTMMMGQVSAAISTNLIGRLCWTQWQEFAKEGMLYWTGTQFTRAYATLSHSIMDMQEKDHFYRKRGNNKKSRSDYLVWYGCFDGCKWPPNVNNLMQVGCVVPGPYLLKLWKHLHYACVPLIWSKLPESIGRGCTLTNANHDIYNEYPVASSLKCTLEFNHTTLLGCLSQAFNIEWYRLHLSGNCNRFHTRTVMSSYLDEYFHNINGMRSLLKCINTKINVFNQMKQAWQKMIEIMIALPISSAWFGNIDLLVSFIRISGAIYTINTENQRLKCQNIFKIITNES